MNTSIVKTRKIWLALLAVVAAFALALCMLSGCSSERPAIKQAMPWAKTVNPS